MTPIRNEAWVLDVFLKITSIWADFIIIADQNSTDGSREIALNYPKVILVENKSLDFNEAERQKMLIDKAREIEGDKILFGLDADEIFAANYCVTEDWQKILNSKPGDVFWFKWAEIRPDLKTYWKSEKTYYPWVFHDDGVEPHSNYVRNMHSMRIPYPIEEKHMFYVDEFLVLHLAYLNSFRVNAKRRFYKFVDWSLNHRSIIKLSRSYAQHKTDPIYPLNDYMLYTIGKHSVDFFNLVDKSSTKFWFDEYIVDRFGNYPKEKISKLDIWQKDFCEIYNIKDNRSLFIKLVHYYLNLTVEISNAFVIKAIDKILSKFL